MLSAVVLLSACASPPRAAEPAKAPPTTRLPAGTVLDVGPQAEGVAVDPVTHLAAVGVREPFRVVLVDLRTGRVVRSVPVSGHVRHLSLQRPGGPVLVPLEDSGVLLSLALPSGKVLTSTPTPGYPHGVAAVGRDAALVGNEKGHRVTLVRGGRVVATDDEFPQPGGMTTSGDSSYVVDVKAATVTRLASDTLRHLSGHQVGDGPTHAVTDVRGDVVVVDTRGDAVFVLRPDLSVRLRRPLSGTPYGVAYDAARDTLWVTLTARNEIVGLHGPDLREERRLPTVRQPNTVGVDPTSGTVVVASRSDGRLQLLRP